MTRRSRTLAYGGAGLLVVAGAASAVLFGGGLGQILALVLVGLGLVALTSLVFLEVGLSEDRERARETAAAAPKGGRSPRRRALRPRLERMRGQSRRLKR